MPPVRRGETVGGVLHDRPVPIVGTLERHRVDVVGRTVVDTLRGQDRLKKRSCEISIFGPDRACRDLGDVLTVDEVVAFQDPAVLSIHGDVLPMLGRFDLNLEG